MLSDQLRKLKLSNNDDARIVDHPSKIHGSGWFREQKTVCVRGVPAFLTFARRVVLIMSWSFIKFNRELTRLSCAIKMHTISRFKSAPSIDMLVNLFPNERIVRDDVCRGEGDAIHGEQMWKRGHLESRTSKPCFHAERILEASWGKISYSVHTGCLLNEENGAFVALVHFPETYSRIDHRSDRNSRVNILFSDLLGLDIKFTRQVMTCEMMPMRRL